MGHDHAEINLSLQIQNDRSLYMSMYPLFYLLFSIIDHPLNFLSSIECVFQTWLIKLLFNCLPQVSCVHVLFTTTSSALSLPVITWFELDLHLGEMATYWQITSCYPFLRQNVRNSPRRIRGGVVLHGHTHRVLFTFSTLRAVPFEECAFNNAQ